MLEDKAQKGYPDGVRRNISGRVLTITREGITYKNSSELGIHNDQATYRSADGNELDPTTRSLMLKKYPK